MVHIDQSPNRLSSLFIDKATWPNCTRWWGNHLTNQIKEKLDNRKSNAKKHTQDALQAPRPCRWAWVQDLLSHPHFQASAPGPSTKSELASPEGITGPRAKPSSNWPRIRSEPRSANPTEEQYWTIVLPTWSHVKYRRPTRPSHAGIEESSSYNPTLP